MNLKGEPAHVGRHCGSSTYEVSDELVRFYADALDDHHALYEKWAPPLLFHSECYKFLGEWYLKNLFGNLHGRQDWELFAPVPRGARVRTRSTLVDRYARRGRDWVVNETDLVLADGGPEDGRLLVRGRTHQSFLPPKPRGEEPGSAEAAEEQGREAPAEAGGGFVVDADSAGRKAPRPPFPTVEGPDVAAVSHLVDARRCWMFSGPGRNYHNDRDEARKLGFPDIVVQGMMSTCFVSQAMLEAFGEGWLCGGRMSVKLVNVLWVDERVTTRVRVAEEVPEGTRTRVLCEVWVEKDDATRVVLGSASALRS